VKAKQTVERVIGGVGVAIFALAPLLFSVYTVDQLMTLMLIYAMVAMSLVFLASYGGMVSLAQTALFGIAGFVFGNMTTIETKGLALGYSPWWGIVPPDIIGTTDAHPHRIYYLTLVLAVLVYALIRYLIRTPFGIALQGVRDEPVRMSSLGYSVVLHRTLAFGVGAFVAATAGLLFVWWNGHVDPQTINVGATINILIIAVIGGLRRLEGAFVGAIAFVFINDRLAATDFSIGSYKLGTFNSLIGLLFLAIVLLSPDGLLGIWERGTDLLKRRRSSPVPAGD
jgi:branched-chain amino acid transport system permease protein